ncbi:MAG: hypothetical protein ACYCQK_05095 [Acidiferrobacteraceae bacterium]
MSDERSIRVVRAWVSVRVRVSLELIRARLGDLAAEAGPSAARYVHEIAVAERLGYYPALTFFEGHPGFPPGLIAAIEETGRFVCDYVARELRNRLWTVFSRIEVQRVHLSALSLSRIRTTQPDALAALVQHCTPSEVSLNLLLSSLHKGPAAPEQEARLVVQKVGWWLRDAFESVDVRCSRVMNE